MIQQVEVVYARHGRRRVCVSLADELAEKHGFSWINSRGEREVDGRVLAVINEVLDRNKELVDALRVAKEVIDDQATRFHKDCRCQLCESAPMIIDAAL